MVLFFIDNPGDPVGEGFPAPVPMGGCLVSFHCQNRVQEEYTLLCPGYQVTVGCRWDAEIAGAISL